MRRRDGVVQMARRIEFGKGSSGVAANLEREFVLLGVPTARLTLETLGLSQFCDRFARVSPTAGQLVEVVLYSFVAPVVWLLKYRRTHIGISHNDCLLGDVFVNHGVHKSVVLPRQGRPRYRLFLHPLHLFLLGREELRYRLPGRRVIVNFSPSGEAEHSSYFKLRHRLVTIPNGVDLTTFKPDPASRTATRRTLGISDQSFLVIFVGNEYIRKGLDIAISALRGVPAATVLAVVGGTPAMIERVDRQGSGPDRLVFLGQRLADLPAIYAAADLLVLPSAQEAWPLVLLEAMACGVPCVATPISSIPDVIQHGVNGWLAERTPEAFTAAITELASDPARHAALSEAAIQSASHYGWDSIARRYLDLVKEVA